MHARNAGFDARAIAARNEAFLDSRARGAGFRIADSDWDSIQMEGESHRRQNARDALATSKDFNWSSLR